MNAEPTLAMLLLIPKLVLFSSGLIRIINESSINPNASETKIPYPEKHTTKANGSLYINNAKQLSERAYLTQQNDLRGLPP